MGMSMDNKAMYILRDVVYSKVIPWDPRIVLELGQLVKFSYGLGTNERKLI